MAPVLNTTTSSASAKKEADGDIAKRSYALRRLRRVNLTCTIGPGECTLELNAKSMDPLQAVALVIGSREGFERLRVVPSSQYHRIANAKGVVIAKDVADLHGTNNLTKQTALTEKGDVVNGRGDTPNMHDILTGSQPDGTAFPAGEDRTCGNWTKNGAGSAMLGHSDRTGLDESAPAKSWNSSHPSRGPGGGCSQDDLKSTGGNGLLYCFATN